MNEFSAPSLTTGQSTPAAAIDLSITGLTCAACSARIEKVLTRLPGVLKAEVNLATDRARVSTSAGAVTAVELVAAIEKAGYGAAVVTSHDTLAADDDKAAVRARRAQGPRACAKKWVASGPHGLNLTGVFSDAVDFAPASVAVIGSSAVAAGRLHVRGVFQRQRTLGG